MHTVVIRIDPENIDRDLIKYAADIIRKGGLVAFPTETVYGLGANALDETAVENIFKAKGRPQDNPLIVHLADKCEVSPLVDNINPGAARLMDVFWPGPLTLVMARSNIIPDAVTAGLETIAVRVPSHPVALALIKEAGVPVAAPSANKSGRPSPTVAGHVVNDLSGHVDVIIDAGSTDVGLESTVIDVTVSPPVILRPGGVTPLQLKAVLPEIAIDPAVSGVKSGIGRPKSPGMKYAHYSPKAQMIIVQGETERVVGKINEMAAEYTVKGISVGVLATDQTRDSYNTGDIISVGDRDRPDTIAANLFKVFREFDEHHVQVILAEAIDNRELGLAVMNRMQKAAGGNIIIV